MNLDIIMFANCDLFSNQPTFLKFRRALPILKNHSFIESHNATKANIKHVCRQSCANICLWEFPATRWYLGNTTIYTGIKKPGQVFRSWIESSLNTNTNYAIGTQQWSWTLFSFEPRNSENVWSVCIFPSVLLNVDNFIS